MKAQEYLRIHINLMQSNDTVHSKLWSADITQHPLLAVSKFLNQNNENSSLVRPHVDQAMPITSVDFIALFIVKKSSDVFQSCCHCTSHH
ncbi:hypothetical protein OIU84_015400 [Salix udensis]|uniref:Uncharacterized protein n=1 Tax=Salix udensis TaxID=889485 RepID=A0AAD6JE46_9ROSI|nr:hypothetical protein OIU84_015400 [Salix udensis]